MCDRKHNVLILHTNLKMKRWITIYSNYPWIEFNQFGWGSEADYFRYSFMSTFVAESESWVMFFLSDRQMTLESFWLERVCLHVHCVLCYVSHALHTRWIIILFNINIENVIGNNQVMQSIQIYKYDIHHKN